MLRKVDHLKCISYFAMTQFPNKKQLTGEKGLFRITVPEGDSPSWQERHSSMSSQEAERKNRKWGQAPKPCPCDVLPPARLHFLEIP